MNIEEWEKRYVSAFDNISKILNNIDGVFVAYNSNVDAIKHINESDFQKLVSLVGSKEVQKRVSEYPREVTDPADFVARLLIAMRDGKAAEVPTYTTEIHQWLTKNLGYDKARMGGQAGIISNLLANIGINNVITYVPWLSKEQAEFFVKSPNLKYPVINNDHLELKHPIDVYNENQKPKVNWILEFSKGMQITCCDDVFEIPRDNRLIISSRPPWLRIDMDEELYNKIPQLRKAIDGAILAGYQMIKEEYDDGHTYQDYIIEAVSVIKKLKINNPDMKIHIEFTSIQNRVIREAILKDIVSQHVTSLGVDTVEVANALNVLGYEELSYAIMNKGENSISALYEGAVKLLLELKLERIHVHSLGFFISVVSRDFPLSFKEQQDALMFAGTLAAARALNGDIENLEQARSGLNVPVYETGYKQLKQLEKYLIKREICTLNEFNYGCVSAPNHDLIIVPTKIVQNPKATVGIGDTISAGEFIALLAMINDKKQGV